MHRNYYTFASQTHFLNQVLNQTRIISCFTHRKNELVIEFESQQVHYLRIGIDPQQPYILVYDKQTIKDPKIDFFTPVCGEKIHSISIKPLDKYIQIATVNHRIDIKFYGKSANIYLFDNSANLIDSFKSRPYETETFTSPDKLSFEVNISEFSKKISEQKSKTPIINAISNIISGVNTIFASEICHRSGFDESAPLNQLTNADQQNLVNNFQTISKEIKASRAWIYKLSTGVHVFSSIPLQHLSNIEQVKEFDTVNQGWISFIQDQKHKLGFDKQLNEIHSVLKKRIDYLERTLKKIADAELLEKRKKEAELKGHLLQTFAHEIPKGLEKVKLKNIFNDETDEIEIKLNPAKSIHENAQKYFEKFKNIEEQKDRLIIKKDTYQHELESCKSLKMRAEQVSSLKEIEKIQKDLVEKNILQDKSLKQADRENLGYSFNRLLLGKKWEIFVGKNAANNDLLTFKFAHKHDIWLHAQGVPGSHVVIRKPDRTQNPPPKIIEQAASIAAYNSDGKHSSTMPVNYTEVRYVRKPRKAPPGTVTIINEKTVFVKPVKMF